MKPAEQLKQEKENRNKRRARIIVRNISYKSTEAKLKEHFSKFGNIVDVNILTRADGKLVGCAFVQFEKVTQAAKAILTTGKEVLGRAVHIDWAINKTTFSKHVNANKNVKKEEVNAEIKEEEELEDVSIKSEDDSNESDQDGGEDSDEDEDDGSDEEDKKDIKSEIKLTAEDTKKRISNDVVEGCTVFIKNIPFECTNEDLKKCGKQFGPIYYALINVDHVSGHSKGTGFVKFRVKQ